MAETRGNHFPVIEPLPEESLRTYIARLAESLGWPPTNREADSALFAQLLERHCQEAEALSIASYVFRALSFTAVPSMATSHFVRFVDALGDQGAQELRSLRDNSEHLHFLCSLFSFSDFLSEQVIRDPSILARVFRTPGLDTNRSVIGYLALLDQSLPDGNDPEATHTALVKFKNQELIRIAIRDLLEKGNAEELCHELSNLAEAILRRALDHVMTRAVERFGRPATEVSGAGHGFVVYAMGKFGGGELNFSSDLDLIFIYDCEGQTTGTGNEARFSKVTSNHEFYDFVGRELVGILSRRTAAGFLYRVDMRLRPEGVSGPLVRSIAGLSSYLSGHAGLWEKVAWLKARPAAGDLAVAEAIAPMITQFVYTGNRAEILLPEIARLKHRIDFDALDAQSRTLDIKRGIGGIREIEFVIATRQMLFGEQEPSLRIRPTIVAVRLLAEDRLLDSAVAEQLIEAYWFFRQIEHTLQMMHESQTHELPADREERAVLALRCGYSIAGDFEARLDQQRRFVRAQFESLFGQATSVHELTLVDYLFGDKEPPDSVLQPLADAGLDPREGFEALRRLAVGTQEFAPSTKAQQSFQQLLPGILEELPQVAMPNQVIRQFDLLLRSAGGYTWVYELCLTNRHILKLFFRVLGYGSLIARQLCAHPEWLDELFANHGLHEERLEQRVAALPDLLGAIEGSEERFRAIRQFKVLEGFLLSVQEILAITSSEDASVRMARLAEATLAQLAREAERQTLAHFHLDAPPARWTVIALGGLGDRHVHYNGDVDLLFAFEVTGDEDLAKQWADKLARTIINEFAALTPEGQLWKVDARLRPDGRNSPLPVTVQRIVDYYRDEAGIWEWQAISKARVVAGDVALGQQLLQQLYAIYKSKPVIPNLAEEILAMKTRIEESFKLPAHASMDLKRSPGGIVDVEFLVQFEILRRPAMAEKLFPLTTLQAIDELGRIGAFSEALSARLCHQLLLLRATQRALRLLFETTTDFLPADGERYPALRRALSDQLFGRLDEIDNLEPICRDVRSQFLHHLTNPGHLR